jgi:hypothetical protein
MLHCEEIQNGCNCKAAMFESEFPQFCVKYPYFKSSLLEELIIITTGAMLRKIKFIEHSKMCSFFGRKKKFNFLLNYHRSLRKTASFYIKYAIL